LDDRQILPVIAFERHVNDNRALMLKELIRKSAIGLVQRGLCMVTCRQHKFEATLLLRLEHGEKFLVDIS
jgi:hypothetical protein